MVSMIHLPNLVMFSSMHLDLDATTTRASAIELKVQGIARNETSWKLLTIWIALSLYGFNLPCLVLKFPLTSSTIKFESPITINHWTCRDLAASSPNRRASYFAILLVHLNWTLRANMVYYSNGDMRTIPALAPKPAWDLAPSKYMIHISVEGVVSTSSFLNILLSQGSTFSSISSSSKSFEEAIIGAKKVSLGTRA